MSDVPAFFYTRGGKKPRKYRNFICEPSAKTTVTQREQEILDDLKVKPALRDVIDSDDSDDSVRPSFFSKACVIREPPPSSSWAGETEADVPYVEKPVVGPSLVAFRERSARLAEMRAEKDSNDSSSSFTTREGSGAVNRPTLRGSGGIYRPPMRGHGEVCPPKVEKEKAPPCTCCERSSLGDNVDTVRWSHSGRWVTNGSGASRGGQGCCRKQTNQKNGNEIVVRFSDSKILYDKKREKRAESENSSSESKVCNGETENSASSSGSEASAPSGIIESSGGGSGLTDNPNATGSRASGPPRNPDGDSKDSSSSHTARGGSGAINWPTVQGGVGIYKPPMRGLGEVCPPKEEGEVIAPRSQAGGSSMLGGKMDTSAAKTVSDAISPLQKLPNGVNRPPSMRAV